MTYIPTRRGFLYLAALVDWYSRKGLGWQLSNARDAEACAEALKKALAKRATPEIFTTDQGSQFTSGDWIDVLTDAKVKISMGGKGRWIDNRGIDTHRVVTTGGNRRSATTGSATAGSSDTGDPSKTHASVCMTLRKAQKRRVASEHGGPITTPSARTRPTVSCPRIKPVPAKQKPSG